MNNLHIPGTIQYLIITLLISFFALFMRLPISHAALSANDMQNPTLVTNEGFKYLGRGGSQNFDKAEEYFRKALNLDPYYADAYVGLGKLNMEKNRHPYGDYKKDQCQQSLYLFERAISLDHKNYRANFNKCLALLCIEDFDNALSTADRLEELNDFCEPHYFRAKAYKGKYLKNKGSHDKKMAILEATDYMECGQTDPNLASRSINLFRDIMRTIKDFDATEKHLKRNIEKKPNSWTSYYNYFDIILMRTDAGYFKDTDVAEVAKTVREGKEKTGMDIGSVCELRGHRGSYYFNTKKYDQAFAEYAECLAVEPGHPAAKANVSFMCSKLNDDYCIKFWRNVIQNYIKRGDCENAAKEFQSQYANRPDAFEPMKKTVMQCRGEK